MSSTDNELMQELLKTFRAEAQDHILVMNQILLQVERQPDGQKPLLQEAFRAAHSLKGAARAVGMNDIEMLAHMLESILQRARDNTLKLSADICDALYDALDSFTPLLNGDAVDVEQLRSRLSLYLEENQAGTVAPGAPAEADHSIPVVDTTIRVSIDKLDQLMAQVGELLISKISADQRLHDVRDLRYTLQHWGKTWRAINILLNKDADPELADLLHGHAKQMQTVMQAFEQFDRDSRRDTLHLNMVTSSLQDTVRNVRMVPFQTISMVLERAVRDVARSAGKQVEFKIRGGEVDLDKKILEMLKDPLLHLLRNAVGHGIEAPDARVAAGKPPIGSVSITVRPRGSEVHIMVSDDGMGFDLDALRLASGGRGSAAEENPDDAIWLAFLPGVTTSSQVTMLEGRGVGLDIVRRQVEAIQGRIAVKNQPGKGVHIELIVQTSLALTRGLVIRIGDESYVLPLLSVEKIIEPQNIFLIGNRQMLRFEGVPLPLVSLAMLLDRPLNDKRLSHPMVVIISVAEQRLALLVDDVLTEQELTVKTLDAPLKRVRNVSGVALLGSGQPIIVLNPADLIRSVGQMQQTQHTPVMTQEEAMEENSHASILVVDDSITTRTLEKNILEAAGYIVTTATNGEEAVKHLKGNTVDLVVSDVQMPLMDGFVLTENIRDAYPDLPIILVSSLENPDDREHGLRAGANAYIVKRGFNQSELLTTIANFLGRK